MKEKKDNHMATALILIIIVCIITLTTITVNTRIEFCQEKGYDTYSSASYGMIVCETRSDPITNTQGYIEYPKRYSEPIPCKKEMLCS